MIRLTIILLFSACFARGAGSDLIRLDSSVLAEIPKKRHAALILFAITGRDSTPEIGEKKAKYIETLKGLIQELRSTYYWHSEFPKDIDQAIERQAIYLAGLHYPASPTTGASYYGDLVQSYTIALYENEIVTIGYAVSERFHEKDVVVHGDTPKFTVWKQAWDAAGAVENGPNQRPEPMAVLRTAMAHH